MTAHDAFLPPLVGGPRRQRLRQGCQKGSVTVSLRGEGGLNSTRPDSRSRDGSPGASYRIAAFHFRRGDEIGSESAVL